MSALHHLQWKNLPVAIKLSVPGLVFSLALLYSLVSVKSGLDAQHDTAMVVNIAGRQRMLNQRLDKEVLARRLDPSISFDGTLKLLASSAHALRHGGEVNLGAGKSATLPPCSADLEKLIDEQMEQIAAIEVSSRELSQKTDFNAADFQKLETQTARLHTTANALVTELQARAEAALSALVTRSTVLALLAIALGASITFLVLKKLLRSLASVSRAVQKIAAGDLDFDLPADRDDELGQMARHVNNALQGIRASVGDVRVDWDEVARQKENEGRLRSVITMVEHAPGGLLHGDEEGRLAFLNPAAESVLKNSGLIKSAEDAMGGDLHQLLQSAGCPRRGFQDPASLPWSMLAPVGERSLQLNAAAIVNDQEEFVGALLSLEDVTDRVLNEQRVREAAERERKQNTVLSRGVDKILTAVGAAAKGDLRVRTGITGHEPVERVGAELDNFLEVLERNMVTIASNIRSLSMSADELSRTGHDLGEGANSTAREANSAAEASEMAASNVTQIAAAIEEMTASMSEISSSAQSAAEVAKRAVDAAQESNRLVTKLGDRSREIGDVIKVISAIAGQTNLLALNATIEAARAGDAGKGFAVVAHEVKELASETARATEEISSRIDVIQEDIGSAVKTIRDIGEIIDRINETQGTIAAAVEEQSATTGEMGRSVNQTARSTDAIRSSISIVAEQADLTAKGSRRSGDASQIVRNMVQDLEQLLSFYQVEEHSMSPSRVSV